MKIINATWELDNLGLRTCEVIFKRGESAEHYLLENLENRYQYIVVKIPSGEIKLIHNLESLGFRYIENQFIVSVNTGDHLEMNKKYLDFFSDVTYSPVRDDIDLNVIKNHISEGMFLFDRISLDPIFNKETSIKRLNSWISELFNKKDTEVYIIRKSGRNAGFLIVEFKEEKKVSIPLAGLFPEYANTGLAFFIIYFTKILKDRGIRNIQATYSSNNKNMFNIISRLIRYRIVESYIVLRKVI